ncbi:MAG: hypothetical protein ACKOPO_10350 [Novosphingobium sp.]
MTQVEAAITGKSPGEIDAAALADLALAGTAPFDDSHASAEYRRTVGRRIFEKTLREATGVREAA